MKFKEDEAKEERDVDKIHHVIDAVLDGQSPSEMQRIRDNRHFIKDISEKPLPDNKAHVKVFGVKDVNINAILKDNIWHRGIFVTDHVARQVFQLRYEQIKRWMGQKRKKPFEHWMLVLLIIGVAVALVIILILMNVKIDPGKLFG